MNTTFMTVAEGHERLRKMLRLKPDEPKFVRGRLEPRTPVRIILDGEGRVADAVATGKRDHKGRYIIWYVDMARRKKRLALTRLQVMLP